MVTSEGTSINRPDAKSLLLIYETIEAELDKQFSQIDSLNTRAHQLLGFAAIALGVVVTLRPPAENRLISVLFGLAVLGFAFIAGSGVRAWSLQGWRNDPKPRPLWERHRLRSEEWLRHQIILNRLDAADANAAAIDAKLYWVRWTQRLLAVEVVYLASLVIVAPYLA